MIAKLEGRAPTSDGIDYTVCILKKKGRVIVSVKKDKWGTFKGVIVKGAVLDRETEDLMIRIAIDFVREGY